MKWFLFLLIFLIACGGSSVEFNPHSGTRGVEIDFAAFTQDEMFVGGELTLGVEIENNGAEDIEKAKLVISTERGLFSTFENVKEIALEGKETTRLTQGEKIIEVFSTTAQAIPATEELETIIRADVCYPYKTIASFPVCIDTDILDEMDEKPAECPPRPQSLGGGQGAPIAVTRMEPFMRPTSDDMVIPTFDFEIRNVDNGIVYDHAQAERACTREGVGRDIWGYVDTGDIYLGNDLMTCNKVQLKTIESERENDYYEGAVIRCEGPAVSQEQAPYITGITINLLYGYRINEEHTVLIRQQQ